MLSCFFKPKKKEPIQIIVVHKHLAVEQRPQSPRHGSIVYRPYDPQRDKIINRNVIAELRESPEYSHIPRIN